MSLARLPSQLGSTLVTADAEIFVNVGQRTRQKISPHENLLRLVTVRTTVSAHRKKIDPLRRRWFSKETTFAKKDCIFFDVLNFNGSRS